MSKIFVSSCDEWLENIDQSQFLLGPAKRRDIGNLPTEEKNVLQNDEFVCCAMTINGKGSVHVYLIVHEAIMGKCLW